MNQGKVVIIGAGHVGSHCAYALAASGVCGEIVLVDSVAEKAAAQAMDVADSVSFLDRNVTVRSGGYGECKDADLTVVAIGEPRLPGQTRLDLLGRSVELLKGLGKELKPLRLTCPVVTITNPADIVADYLRKSLKLERWRCFGTGTLLDTARLVRVIGQEAGTDRRSVCAFSMGEHGDSMFIPTSRISVEGIGLREYLSLRDDVVDSIDFDDVMRRVRESGAALISGKGCTEFGIASVVSTLVTSILHNEKRVVPLSAHLEGEYGESGISAGVPCVIGDTGVDAVLEIDLSYDERRAMRKSCSIIRDYCEKALPAEE